MKELYESDVAKSTKRHKLKSYCDIIWLQCLRHFSSCMTPTLFVLATFYDMTLSLEPGRHCFFSRHSTTTPHSSIVCRDNTFCPPNCTQSDSQPFSLTQI